MGFVYRPETPDDESFLRALISESLIEQLSAWAWPEPIRTSLIETQYQVQRQGFRSSGDTSVIVLDDETPVGWYVTAENADRVHLVNIMVLSRHRNQGVGTTVLHTLLATAEAAGKPLRLSVAVNNVRAQQFYERLGFCRRDGDEVQHLMERSPQSHHAA